MNEIQASNSMPNGKIDQSEAVKSSQSEAEKVAYGEKVTRLDFYLGSFGSSVPMLVFIVWAITLSILLADFGAPDESGLILGMLAGLVAGLLLSRGSWSDYCQAIFDGLSQPVGVIAVVCWIWAGMFAKVLSAGGLVDGLVWLGSITGFSGGAFVVSTFLLSAVFATAVGTGYGTTIAFCELMYPAGIVLGADPVVLFAAILSGSAFGDNLAPVSDTTIVSAVTQETDVPGVVRSRFKYALAAAIPSVFLFAMMGGGGTVDPVQAQSLMSGLANPAGLILLIPFVLVIVLAMTGRHIIVSITWGILVAVGIILLSNVESIADVLGGPLAHPGAILALDVEKRAITGALIDGINGFIKMGILILFIVTAGHIMTLGGALDGIKRIMMKVIKRSVRRAEVVIFATVASLNAFITVNTAAEIAAAPFVRDMGKAFHIHPYRRANFLDAVSSAFGYIFPWSGGVLIGVATLQGLSGKYDFFSAPSPMNVWPYVFHGWFLAAVMVLAAITGFGRRYEDSTGAPTKIPPELSPVEDAD